VAHSRPGAGIGSWSSPRCGTHRAGLNARRARPQSPVRRRHPNLRPGCWLSIAPVNHAPGGRAGSTQPSAPEASKPMTAPSDNEHQHHSDRHHRRDLPVLPHQRPNPTDHRHRPYPGVVVRPLRHRLGAHRAGHPRRRAADHRPRCSGAGDRAAALDTGAGRDPGRRDAEADRCRSAGPTAHPGHQGCPATRWWASHRKAVRCTW
jgi:hypothetical protein